MFKERVINNLEKLNSITKYPSIGTYHQIGERGKLNEILNEEMNECVAVYCTEKVDGTNTRIILTKDDYIIGSRDKLLYAKGDRIINETMDIVTVLKPIADKLLIENNYDENEIIVVYGEVYGGNIGRNKKNYTSTKKLGYRVFDVALYSDAQISDLIKENLEHISTWREHGGQGFINLSHISEFCDYNELEKVPMINIVRTSELPKTIEDTYKFMIPFMNTKVGLDNHGMSEGIVIRSSDRKYIRKLRFEEYKKTLGIR